MTNVVYSQSLGRNWDLNVLETQNGVTGSSWQTAEGSSELQLSEVTRSRSFPKEQQSHKDELLGSLRFVLLWQPWRGSLRGHTRWEECTEMQGLGVTEAPRNCPSSESGKRGENVCSQNPGQQRFIRTQIPGMKETVSICVFSQDQTQQNLQDLTCGRSSLHVWGPPCLWHSRAQPQREDLDWRSVLAFKTSAPLFWKGH